MSISALFEELKELKGKLKYTGGKNMPGAGVRLE